MFRIISNDNRFKCKPNWRKKKLVKTKLSWAQQISIYFVKRNKHIKKATHKNVEKKGVKKWRVSMQMFTRLTNRWIHWLADAPPTRKMFIIVYLLCYIKYCTRSLMLNVFVRVISYGYYSLAVWARSVRGCARAHSCVWVVCRVLRFVGVFIKYNETKNITETNIWEIKIHTIGFSCHHFSLRLINVLGSFVMLIIIQKHVHQCMLAWSSNLH